MADEIQGKYFSIFDPQGQTTVVYRVLVTAQSLQNKLPKYTTERLFCSEEIVNQGKKKTFFIDFPKSSGEDLIILSFVGQKVVVNMGVLKDNKVNVSRRPVPIKFATLYSEKPTEYKSFKYTPELKRDIRIIDPETTKEVEAMTYIDETTHEVRGKCKLKPNKSYFFFEIKDDKR